MAHLEFREKMSKFAKDTIFQILRQVEVSASHMLLGIYLREVLIFSQRFEIFERQNPKMWKCQNFPQINSYQREK